jgi:urease alpha subunit
MSFGPSLISPIGYNAVMKKPWQARTYFVLFLSALLFMMAGCAGKQPAADTIILNARVYTVNAAQPWAEAVAVKDGRILFVGSTKEAKRFKSKDTRVIDAGGRLVLPGIEDSHVHFVSGSKSLARVDLAGTKTVEEIQVRIHTGKLAILIMVSQNIFEV